MQLLADDLVNGELLAAADSGGRQASQILHRHWVVVGRCRCPLGHQRLMQPLEQRRTEAAAPLNGYAPNSLPREVLNAPLLHDLDPQRGADDALLLDDAHGMETGGKLFTELRS